MGLVKEEFIRYQEAEGMIDWLEDNYEEEFEFEGDGWDEAVQFFEDCMVEKRRRAVEIEALERLEEAEYLDYLSEHIYIEIYQHIDYEIHKLELFFNNERNDASQESFILKMTFAHLITLLETYLADTIKSLCIEREDVLMSLINGVDELKNMKFGFKDFLDSNQSVKTLVLKQLSQLMYHNIPKIMNVYKCAFGKVAQINYGEAIKLTKMRHDIVHRNGKSVDGEHIALDKELLLNSFTIVRDLIENLHNVIDDTCSSSKEE